MYLLKLHTEGQLPYRPLVRNTPTGDAAVREAQRYLEDHLRDDRVLVDVADHVGVAERTLKRRFKQATGTTLIEYLQNLRVEEAKRALETSRMPVEEISFAVGYEDPSFFRRLFKRCVGLTPREYRRMFQGVASVSSAVA